MPITYIDEQPKKSRITYLDDNNLATQQKELLSKAKGTIVQNRPIENVLPSAGQFAGGLAGGLNRPLSAVLGTVGRVVGRLGQREMQQRREGKVSPLDSISQAAIPGLSAVNTLRKMSPEERGAMGREMATTAGVEALGIPLGFAADKVIKGIPKMLMSKEAAERGTKRGFDKLIQPKFMKEELPNNLVEATSNVVKTQKNVAGSSMSNLINKKYKDNIIDLSDIKDKVQALTPKGITYEDFEFTSPMQRKLMARIHDKVLGIGSVKGKLTGNQMAKAMQKSREISLPKLWELRKEIDDIMFRTNWSPEAKSYMNGLRNILNKPIREISPEIAKLFDRYTDLSNIEEVILGNMLDKTVQSRISGNTLSPGVETLIRQLSSKPELFKTLKEVNPKMAEMLMDVSVGRKLVSPTVGGLSREGLLKRFNIPLKSAQLSSALQKKRYIVPRSILGRGAITGTSEMMGED